MKNYYELLELPRNATFEEVKKTFRVQIARYHPDKVHHLGKEFQEIAATRAAELTEAYRILSHEGRRAEYDAQLGAAAPETVVDPSPPTHHGPKASDAPGSTSHASQGDPETAQQKEAGSRQFSQERATRDTFVRGAIVERLRHAIAQVAGSGYEESHAKGFDIACLPKSKMFGRAKGPRLLAKFVSHLDAPAVADAWGLVAKSKPKAGEEVCVILVATHVAPAKELAGAIAEQRRRPIKDVKITLVPVNASVWEAHMPVDAPDLAKNLLNRLRTGS